MGRSSGAKQQKPAKADSIRRAKERTQLLDLLEEQRQFLQASCMAFDAGNQAEAKRIAVALRVLLHDTKLSRSLLAQLSVKDSVRWIDTSEPIVPGNILPGRPGLVLMTISPAQSPFAYYTAPLDGAPPDHYTKQRLSFESWWTMAAMRSWRGRDWSRKDLVLALANKDGGAHVDPDEDQDYELLARHNGPGMIASIDGDLFVPFEGNAALPAVRQIAYELERSLSESGAPILCRWTPTLGKTES